MQNKKILGEKYLSQDDDVSMKAILIECPRESTKKVHEQQLRQGQVSCHEIMVKIKMKSDEKVRKIFPIKL